MPRWLRWRCRAWRCLAVPGGAWRCLQPGRCLAVPRGVNANEADAYIVYGLTERTLRFTARYGTRSHVQSSVLETDQNGRLGRESDGSDGSSMPRPGFSLARSYSACAARCSRSACFSRSCCTMMRFCAACAFCALPTRFSGETLVACLGFVETVGLSCAVLASFSSCACLAARICDEQTVKGQEH